jgi:hypothetical protein
MPDEFGNEEIQYDEDGNEVPVSPSPRPVFTMPSVFPQSQQEEPEAEHKVRPNPDDAALDDDDIEDIFESGERSDGTTDELERDDFSDILDVSDEDVTGYKQEKPKQRFSRTPKKFRPNNPPPTRLGGMQQY